MKAICCWCGKFLGDRPGTGDKVTGGICPDCMERELAEMEKAAKEEKRK